MNKKIIVILISSLFIGTIFTITINAEYNSNIITDFHDNLDGWTIEGDGTAIWKPCSGGYMKVFDVGESVQVLAVSPRKFHGNWSNYYKISINLKRENPTNPDQSPWYYISGPGGSAQYYGSEKPGGSWMTCQVLLQESYWTVTSGNWDDLISNVASFKIDVEMDDIGEEEIGVDYIVLYSSGGGNHAPYTPNDPNPDNLATNVDINTDLSWKGGDPDSGDSVKYDVYFEADNPIPDALVSYHQSNLSFDPGTMHYNKKYYWRIVATDNHGAYSTGPIWDFTTVTKTNNPPDLPSSPYPENGSINVATDITLSWLGGDPDIDDNVTYDVYFRSILPLQKIKSNISKTSINPGPLIVNLTYFWNIVAWDDQGASTVGPIWHFTTRANNLPNKPIKPTIQKKGKIGQNYSFITSTTDPDGDQLYYNWSWGDGTYSGWIGLYDSGENINKSYNWSKKGFYNIKVKAKDIYDAKSDWSDPLSIMITKNKAVITPLFLQRLFQHFPILNKILKQII